MLVDTAQLRAELLEHLKAIASEKAGVDVDRFLTFARKVRDELTRDQKGELGMGAGWLLPRVIPVLERAKALGVQVVLPAPILAMIRQRLEDMAAREARGP